MKFNEDSRVKIPAALHLMRLGYRYLPLKDPKITWDASTSIFTDIFQDNIRRINPGLADLEAEQWFNDISLRLENDDLGKAVYENLTYRAGTCLVDFEDFDNSGFNLAT